MSCRPSTFDPPSPVVTTSLRRSSARRLIPREMTFLSPRWKAMQLRNWRMVSSFVNSAKPTSFAQRSSPPALRRDAKSRSRSCSRPSRSSKTRPVENIPRTCRFLCPRTVSAPWESLRAMQSIMVMSRSAAAKQRTRALSNFAPNTARSTSIVSTVNFQG